MLYFGLLGLYICLEVLNRLIPLFNILLQSVDLIKLLLEFIVGQQHFSIAILQLIAQLFFALQPVGLHLGKLGLLLTRGLAQFLLLPLHVAQLFR